MDYPHLPSPVDPAAFRAAFRQVCDAPRLPSPDWSGRGVVIAAGGVKYFRCAWAAIHVLRHVGCTLPVEVWHLGRSEMDPTMAGLLGGIGGVRVVDAHAAAAALPRPPRRLAGWELKPFAALHSSFAEVLFLDADCLAARDPTPLFDRPEYVATGSIFWPDLPPSRRRSEWVPPAAWAAVGLPHNPAARPFESGQFLIDKGRCVRELTAALWLNEHSDHVYKFIYGDKDTFLLAWAACGTPHAMPASPPSWRRPAILQPGFDGRTLFEHACQGKDGLGDGRPAGTLTHSRVVAAAANDLRSRWGGRLWDWADMGEDEREIASGLTGLWDYHRVGLDRRPLELRDGGHIGVGRAGCERRWAVRREGERFTLAVSGDLEPTMFMTESAGKWSGRWERHEKAPVVLSRTTRAYTLPPLPLATVSRLAEAPGPPTRPTAVVTLVVGERGEELFALSGPYLAAAAARWGADFVVLRDGGQSYLFAEKFRLGLALKRWARAAYFDADCMVSPAAPNVFDVVPADRIRLYPEGHWYASGVAPDGLYESLTEAVLLSQDLPPDVPPVAHNAGVVVASQCHAGVWEPPAKPFPNHPWSEQVWVNARATPYAFPLPRSWNHIPALDRQPVSPSAFVAHFAGMAHAARLAAMRAWAEGHPLPRAITR